MRRQLSLWALCLVLTVSTACGCQQTAYKELASPNGGYVAVQRETNCGATDPFGTEISIRSREPRAGIALFGFATRRVFLADVALSRTRVTWLDTRTLEIVCTDCEKYGVAEMVATWREVTVKFDVGKAGKGVF
ncbi:MAG TPA: hypothetical protein VJN96_25685 [Vicinamibacterales bacterium]|nr:hypothetical protein [Vicinamibacterales bacterium]